MAADELVGNPAGHVVEVEAALTGGDLGVEEHLQQQVTELLAQVGVVARLDRVQHLAGLLDQIGRQAAVGLFRVPGASLAQGGHHPCQPYHLVAAGLPVHELAICGPGHVSRRRPDRCRAPGWTANRCWR